MGAVGGGRRSAVVPTAAVAHAPTMPRVRICHIRFLGVILAPPSCSSEKLPCSIEDGPAPPRCGRTKEKQRPAGGDAGRCSREGTGWLEGGESQPVLNRARVTGQRGPRQSLPALGASRMPLRDAYACAQLTRTSSARLFSFGFSACNSGEPGGEPVTRPCASRVGVMAKRHSIAVHVSRVRSKGRPRLDLVSA